MKFAKKVPPGGRTITGLTAYINDTGDQNKQWSQFQCLIQVMSIGKQDVAFSTYDSNEKNILLRSVKLIIRHTGRIQLEMAPV